MDGASSLEMVQWPHENRRGGCTSRAMVTAAKHNDFELVLFLHTHRSEGCTNEAAKNAVEHRCFELFQWLCETYPDKVDVQNVGYQRREDVKALLEFMEFAEAQDRATNTRNPQKRVVSQRLKGIHSQHLSLPKLLPVRRRRNDAIYTQQHQDEPARTGRAGAAVGQEAGGPRLHVSELLLREGHVSVPGNYFSSNELGKIGQRGDCGFVRTTVTSCPGEIACSGQGTCRGPPTYDCICSKGFTGASCNRMTCTNDCSGRGTRYTMEELGKRATQNGELMDWSYGAVPNKKESWDYDMVTGCLCSPGWEGRDCSMQSCPTGDDPMTVYNPDDSVQESEVQELICIGTSGFFSLKLREAVTPQLPFSVGASSLRTALSDRTTIGDVAVTYSNGVSACTATGSNVIRLEFFNDFGDLPPLRWIIDGALTMAINVDGVGNSRRGTKENAVCSNRGICDNATGMCRCAFGFTSSDGNGKEGDRGDCGFKDFIYLNSAGKVANEI